MKEIRSKKELAIQLSKLSDFTEQDISLEQYSTPSEIAADWLWNAYQLGDIAGKVILDAACGPGYLGLGASLLGAKKVILLDISPDSLQIARSNASLLGVEAEFLLQNISEFSGQVDTVIENPPFGTKQKHHDKLFLEKAFVSGSVVYSMHKANTSSFVEAISADYSFSISHRWDYTFPIKATKHWHRKRVHNVEVSVWRMIR